ncbi:MAG: hypothetical protein ACXWV1_04295 [Chitinophagaceae bacterium]
MKKVLQIANGVALVATIIINYLSNTGIFNGNTMAVVSARLQNLFTPAGYAFSIWGLIYLGLFAFVIYQGRSLFTKMADDRIVLKIGWWFVVSCISNCLWVLAWLYDYTGVSVLIMLSLLFSLTRIIVKLNMEREKVQLKESVFAWWPFAIYSGWITVALIANVAAYLTKIQWGAWGISETSWAIIMICIAGVINLFVTWNRNMSEFALVGAWALVAIAVANRQVSQPVVQVALTVSVILFMSSAIHMFKTRKFLQ